MRRQSNQSNLRFVTNLQCRPCKFSCLVFFLLSKLTVALTTIKCPVFLLLSFTVALPTINPRRRFACPLVDNTLQRSLHLSFGEGRDIEVVSGGFNEPRKDVSYESSSESSESVPFWPNFRHGADVRSGGQHEFVEEDPLRFGTQTTGWMENNNLHKDE